MFIPKAFVMRDPVSHRTKPLWNKAIAPFSAVPLTFHKPGTQQDPKVLGDSRATHLELSRKRVHRTVGHDQ